MVKKLYLVYIAVLVLLLIYVMYSSCDEGFENEVKRCGVDLPSCSGEHIRCMNGYCRSDIASTLPPISDLRMTPPTSY